VRAQACNEGYNAELRRSNEFDERWCGPASGNVTRESTRKAPTLASVVLQGNLGSTGGHEREEMELDDSVLWARSARGDADAFTVLFERHADEIYNYCFRRIGEWSVAEDVLSIVFLEAWRRRDKELPPGKVLPWLYGIATNVVRNRRRSELRLHRISLAFGPVGSASSGKLCSRPLLVTTVTSLAAQGDEANSGREYGPAQESTYRAVGCTHIERGIDLSRVPPLGRAGRPGGCSDRPRGPERLHRPERRSPGELGRSC